MSDAAVEGAKYGAMYGWARFEHEARIAEDCVKLGAVLLGPATRQARLDEVARPPRDAPVGFAPSHPPK